MRSPKSQFGDMCRRYSLVSVTGLKAANARLAESHDDTKLCAPSKLHQDECSDHTSDFMQKNQRLCAFSRHARGICAAQKGRHWQNLHTYPRPPRKTWRTASLKLLDRRCQAACRPASARYRRAPAHAEPAARTLPRSSSWRPSTTPRWCCFVQGGKREMARKPAQVCRLPSTCQHMPIPCARGLP